MSKILIIGATSTIAQHCARLWAAEGEELFLVGRNAERLDRIVADLSVRGASKVARHLMDINEIESHQQMLDVAERVLGGLDVTLIAHGTLSDQKACEESVSLALQEIKTNALSVIALLTLIGNRYESQRRGTVAIISSVAGDRGRASNYVYGCAKAMVTVFTSGLRQRLHKAGVSVITIKPGFVDTAMTKNFQKGILWADPEHVAEEIKMAVANKKELIVFPRFWLLIMFVVKSIPEGIFKRIKL